MALDRYLAEEICLDHRDGQMSRREALRLLSLMGLGATAAATLLDTSVAGAATATTRRTTPPKVPTPSTKPTSATTSTGAKSTPVKAGTGPVLATSAITFAGPAGELRASYSAPPASNATLGAVLIIHENRGLTDHFKALPGRFARDGYAALAIDLASRVGGTDAVADQMPAPLAQASTADLVADMLAAITELQRRAPGEKVGVIGFCFGGGMVWNLVNSGDARIAAAAPFYGTGPSPADFSTSKAAVLAVYAELDTRVNADRPAMTAALEKAKLVHEIRVFPGVNHAFFNDTGSRYDAKQAGAAYEAVLSWFGRYLA